LILRFRCKPVKVGVPPSESSCRLLAEAKLSMMAALLCARERNFVDIRQ